MPRKRGITVEVIDEDANDNDPTEDEENEATEDEEEETESGG